MTYGDVIYRYRQDHHLSQRAFAIKCKLSNAYIAQLESNSNPTTGKPIKPNVGTLRALAAAMEMTLDELLRIVDDDSPVVVNSSEQIAEGLVSELSQRKRRIMDMYDGLTPENRIRLEAYLAGLTDTQNKPEL